MFPDTHRATGHTCIAAATGSRGSGPRLPSGRAALAGVTELPAHVAATCPNESGVAGQQRKLSSWTAHASGPIAPSPATVRNSSREQAHEAAFCLLEDACPGR